MKTIILHYHLFKNAGTSIDQILKKNFKEKWVTKEFTGKNNTEDVQQWILSNPDAIAFSSHTINGPVPNIEGYNILSIAILREPKSRIISAYNFERKQDSGTWGAQLAKEGDLENYIVKRLQNEKDCQCRNFQTEVLSSLTTIGNTKLERAMNAITSITVLGVVEEFQKSLKLMEIEISKYYPDFKADSVHANQSKRDDKELGASLNQLLNECNKNDHQLWLQGLDIIKNKAG